LAAFEETALGNLCADALRAVASVVVQGTDESEPFAAAVVPSGVIRDPLYAGNTGLLTVADVYNALPLGMSPAGDQDPQVPGWPLLSFYVTAPELRVVGEASVSGSQLLNSSSIWLNFSGVRFERNPDQLMLQVMRVHLCGDALPAGAPLNGDGDLFSEHCDTRLIDMLDNEFVADEATLYRVVVDLYTILNIKMALDAGFEVRPKDAQGAEIDLSDMAALLALRIDADPNTDGIQELTGWQALITFLTGSLEDTGGVADVNEIPAAKYGDGGTAMGRLVDL